VPSRIDSTAKPGRGSLSRPRILEAALRLADSSGLEALSMRRLGAELGVEAMSLYNHVPSKAALLDGMVEAILSEMPSPGAGGSWSERLREMARAFRRALRAHPGALPLFATRPAVTPASLRHVEAALGVLRGAGLSPDESVSALQVLVTFVVGHTLSQVGHTKGDEVSSPRYEALSREEFPHLTEIAPRLGAHDGELEFEFGLDAFLTGLRAKARRHASKTR
jgi:TetR/AcrR family transcriptional regulator, tetracycline repressor protein